MTGLTQRPSRWLARLFRPQSAFTIRDLLNLARADEPHTRLQLIYQWYFDRTMNAIRVAYGAAAGTSAAIYGLAVKNPDSMQHEEFLSRGLAVAAVICVGAGLFQRRELAQLHTEFAAASRLLSDSEGLPIEEMYRPRDRPDAQLSKWLIVFSIAVVVALAIGIWWAEAPPEALTVVALLVAILAAPHIVAELRHRSTHPPKDDLLMTLEERFGDIRLDQYVLDPRVTRAIDRAITDRKARRRDGE